MGLKEQLDLDLREAMRARDEDRLRAIRLLKAAISNLEIARTDPKNPQHGQPVTEGDLVRVVESQIKQRRESAELYRKGSRPELAEKEEAEIRALDRYRPQQMTREEVRAEVEKVVADLGTREFPKVMRESAQRLRGRADGKLVNEVVKEVTAG